MRFIHTGDIHLGAVPDSKMSWSEERGDEIWGTFEKLIKSIKIKPVDMLIIAGDLFHRQPLLRELREVNYLFSTIPDTKVVLCAGNHDAIKKGSFYENFEWNENVIFLRNDKIERVDLPELSVSVYGMSYHSREIEEPVYDHLKPEDSSMINILVAHGGDEKHIPINKRLLALAGFDYVAMGHIHKPDIDENAKMAYCGSLEPIDRNDIGERGYIYGEVTKEGLQLEFKPFAKRIYLEIEYELSDNATNMEIRHKLQDMMEKYGEDNMYKITFTGYRNPDFEIDQEAVMEIGRIVSVRDDTIPDYDFDEMQALNRDNILGMFIARYNKSGMSRKEEKALYYGTKALMDAMEGEK